MRSITCWRDGASRFEDDQLAVEEPLEIRIGDDPMAVTMRTPGHDRDLAAGFCLTEGVIEHPDELETVDPCGEAKHGNVMVVTLTADAAMRRAGQVLRARRELYMSSSCGLCGKQSIDRVEQRVTSLARQQFTLPASVLQAMPEAMRVAQSAFDQTGGLHAAALFRPDGRLRILREDIGRHNAVDKVVGAMLLSGQWPVEDAVLLVSGRASFEIVQKAAVARIPAVAAVSAPSSLATDFAARVGMTLVGFLRPGRMNVYHDVGRIRP